MKTRKHAAIAGALVTAAIASPAMAQDGGTEADVFVGTQIGYHDLGDNPFGDDDGFIYGIYAGVDVPVGEVVFVGLEGNFNLGTNAIDSEYGVAARVGAYVNDSTKLFLRGGYQEINFDVANIVGVPVGGIDDNDGDYLVGGGAEFAINESLSLRAAVDTIAFDTVRLTTGIQLNF